MYKFLKKKKSLGSCLTFFYCSVQPLVQYFYSPTREITNKDVLLLVASNCECTELDIIKMPLNLSGCGKAWNKKVYILTLFILDFFFLLKMKSNQWCAGKLARRGRKPSFTELAHFYAVDTITTPNFKLLVV